MKDYEICYTDNIRNDIIKLDLIKKARHSAYDFFKAWSKESIDEYFGGNFDLETLNDRLELVKYGVQICANQNDLLCFQISFQITSAEESFLCNYYTYFDEQGNLIDNFVDK